MPLFPAFLQFVLKAEGIRSNPNSPPPTHPPGPSLNVPWLVKSGLLGRTGGGGVGCRKTGWQRWGTVCRTWLFRSVDPIRRVVTCLVRGHVPPERRAGGLDSAKGKSVYNCLIWSHSVCIPGAACYMKSDCAKAFLLKWSAYLCNILSNILCLLRLLN